MNKRLKDTLQAIAVCTIISTLYISTTYAEEADTKPVMSDITDMYIAKEYLGNKQLTTEELAVLRAANKGKYVGRGISNKSKYDGLHKWLYIMIESLLFLLLFFNGVEITNVEPHGYANIGIGYGTSTVEAVAATNHTENYTKTIQIPSTAYRSQSTLQGYFNQIDNYSHTYQHESWTSPTYDGLEPGGRIYFNETLLYENKTGSDVDLSTSTRDNDILKDNLEWLYTGGTSGQSIPITQDLTQQICDLCNGVGLAIVHASKTVDIPSTREVEVTPAIPAKKENKWSTAHDVGLGIVVDYIRSSVAILPNNKEEKWIRLTSNV